MGGDVWASGAAYEPHVGRWSRLVSTEFVRWLDVSAEGRWLDVGCGTGAVTDSVLRVCSPAMVVGLDPSEGYAQYARGHVTDSRVGFVVGTATALPIRDGEVDVAVSGLVLNFVPDPEQAVSEMVRVTRPGGTVGSYVWDYAGDMQLMRYFWDSAAALDPRAKKLDEGVRFPLCRPDPLSALFAGVGLADVQLRPIDVATRFRDFDDYGHRSWAGRRRRPDTPCR